MIEDYAKAAWYRIDYFPKLMNIDNKDLFYIAKSYHKRKLYKLAGILYLYYLNKETNDFKLLQEIEDFFLKIGEWKYLKKACKKILLLNPNDFNTLYNLGLSLQNLGQLRESKEVFEKLIMIEKACMELNYTPLDIIDRHKILYLDKN